MPEVPPESTEERASGGPPTEEPPSKPTDPMPSGPFDPPPSVDPPSAQPTNSAEPAAEPEPSIKPADIPVGPFDRLFEELGGPPQPPAPSSWHAAWGPQSPPRPREPSFSHPESPLLRPDDSPFATVAAASPAATPFTPGMYGPPPIAAPAARRSIVRPAGRLVRELAETVVLALAIFLLVRAVVQNFQVEGRSMEPTLETGWYLLVNKAIYWEINVKTVSKFVPFVHPGHDATRYVFRGPKRGDVIVFRQPNQPIGATERDFIKRVIGMPGDVVEVHNGTVFINGKPLHEPYIADKPAYDCPAQRVPPGHYWVLGDNRNNSSDSHSWGSVPKDNIIGNAWLIYWPFHKIGLVNNKHETPDASQPEQVQPPKNNIPLVRTNSDCAVVG